MFSLFRMFSLPEMKDEIQPTSQKTDRADLERAAQASIRRSARRWFAAAAEIPILHHSGFPLSLRAGQSLRRRGLDEHGDRDDGEVLAARLRYHQGGAVAS